MRTEISMRSYPVLLAAFLGVTSAVAAQEAPARPPNVVVIFMDDMGYADIGAFGAEAYETPHLDRLAREGMIFTDFYVTQAVCSASRAGLLTGCYNTRIGILGALGPKARHGLHRDEVTIAEICKQKGFDDYFGLPYSNDMWPFHPGVLHLPMEKRLKRWPHLPLIDGNHIIDAKVTAKVQETLTTRYTERAVAFITKNKDRPFFLYVPHSMVHVPLFVSDKFKGKSGAGLFGDVMMEVDWSVGEILGALHKHDLDRNTLVIFTSDNGPWLSYGDHAGSAGPLREGKGTMFDGGCRESTIMCWPGTVPADSVCHTPAMTIDILPTVAHLVGAKVPDHTIDGKNIWPLIKGVEGARSPQEAYYFYYGRALHAMRMGDWKLHFPHGYRTMAGRRGGTDGTPKRYEQAKIGLSLFNLSTDIGETTDVKDQHPEVVKRMHSLAEAMRQELGDGRDRIGVGARQAGRIGRKGE